MKELNHPHSLLQEKEKLNRVIKECRTKKTSKYIILNRKPYLITPEGVMSYEGTSTTTYSQSQKHTKE